MNLYDALIDLADARAEFKAAAERDDCPTCDGTGEGMFEPQCCAQCRGKGWILKPIQESEDDIRN